MRVIFAAFTIFLTSLSLADEGGGVSNGGNAVQCRGRAPEMIDTFLSDLEVPTSLPSREEFARMIYSRLAAADLDFAAKWKAEWDRLGPSEDWKNHQGRTKRSYDEYLPIDLSQLKKCKVVQVSAFESTDWTPKKVKRNFKHLTVYSRLVLELHESLYVIAARDYQQVSPILTRNLVVVLLLGEPSLIQFELRHFQMKAPGLVPVRESSSLLRRVSPVGGMVNCPEYLAVENLALGAQLGLIFDFPDRAVTLGIYTGQGLSPRFNQSTQIRIGPTGTVISFQSPAYSFEFSYGRSLHTMIWNGQVCRYGDLDVSGFKPGSLFRDIAEKSASAMRYQFDKLKLK